jgi:hypothetical protein
VFWWSPGGTWVSEQIGLTATSTAAQPIERLVCVVQGSNLNIFGRDENSHLIRFFWRVGDGVDWNATDVTGLVG